MAPLGNKVLVTTSLADAMEYVIGCRPGHEFVGCRGRKNSKLHYVTFLCCFPSCTMKRHIVRVSDNKELLYHVIEEDVHLKVEVEGKMQEHNAAERGQYPWNRAQIQCMEKQMAKNNQTTPILMLNHLTSQNLLRGCKRKEIKSWLNRFRRTARRNPEEAKWKDVTLDGIREMIDEFENKSIWDDSNRDDDPYFCLSKITNIL